MPSKARCQTNRTASIRVAAFPKASGGKNYSVARGTGLTSNAVKPCDANRVRWVIINDFGIRQIKRDVR